VIGAASDGKPYHELNPGSKKVILIIGSESHGITGEVISLLDNKCGIPKSEISKAESLNASVACAVLLSHFQKA